MANKIGWTDVTCNPGIHGCEEISPACANCYAAKMAHRQVAMGNYPDGITTKRASGVHWSGKVIVDYDRIGPAFAALPKRLKRCEQCAGTGWTPQGFFGERSLPSESADYVPSKVICGGCNGTGKRRWRVFLTSMSDLFHKDVPDDFIEDVFTEMIRHPHLLFQVLTKRIARALKWWNRWAALDAALFSPTGLTWPDNVWMGCTVEDQKRADRIHDLCQIPAPVRFISYEPALGPLDLSMWLGDKTDDTANDHLEQHVHPGDYQLARGLQWIICGGESGGQARPSYPHWFTDIRDQCLTAGVPFYFKQYGEWAPLTNKPTKHRVEWLDKQGRMGAKADNSDWRIGVHKVGRKAAGRSLYGQTWSQFPFDPSLSPTGKPELAPFYRPWRDTP